jgi:hypothetical protein
MQSEEVKQKSKETCFQNFGCQYPMQSEEIKQKSKETCLENFGCENPSQNEEIRQKIKETCLDKYGCDNPFQNEEIKQKMKKTNMEKRGVEYSSQSEEVKQKSKETCLIKYGFEYAMQNAEIAEKQLKSSHNPRSYYFPSGRIDSVQGYEPFALDELTKIENIDEDDIITNRREVPIIWYEDEMGKKHRYFTDILIKSQKRCIEVKSTWTLKINIDFVFLKQKATIDTGYKCEIWVYNKKGEKVECYKEIQD